MATPPLIVADGEDTIAQKRSAISILTEQILAGVGIGIERKWPWLTSSRMWAAPIIHGIDGDSDTDSNREMNWAIFFNPLNSYQRGGGAMDYLLLGNSRNSEFVRCFLDKVSFGT